MSTRRAEIAGAGIAGLTLASALAQRGWKVRVHERNDELREIGAGIFVWENALRVLEHIGAYDSVANVGHHVSWLKVWDDNLRIVQQIAFKPDDSIRLLTVRRQDLYSSILRAAIDSGVDVVTRSLATAADPSGRLVMDGGSVAEADLVVAADGATSRIRESLGLTKRNQQLAGGTVRVLISRPQEELDDPRHDVVQEYWRRERRLLYVPVAEDEVYIALGTIVSDTRGKAVPVDKQTWRDSFPHMAFAIDRIDKPGRWDQFRDVRVTSWYRGRVALVGDAAHAQPPHLAQGAALSMCNAVALADALENRSVEDAMSLWEARQRPLTRHTQRWTRLYGFVVASIPSRATKLRSRFIGSIKGSRLLQAQLNRAAHYDPIASLRR
jgi:2-polyprenyl-6-methoxyphenol hydroxylase-like FAD-dependent oxidoreductase